LDNGVIIKLPEDNIDGALARLTKLDKDQNLLQRDIAAVDLRIDDRTAIELTPDAAVRRQAAVDARNKALKKAGQDT
jgi:cell division protein FtsQ